MATAGAGVALGTTAGAGTALGAALAASVKPHTAADLEVNLIWQVPYPHAQAPIALSSPVLVDLPSGPAMAVAARSGHVYAIYLQLGSNGRAHKAWTVETRGPTPSGLIGDDSSPSSWNGVTYFGVGSRALRGHGGYEAVNANGSVKWTKKALNPSSDPGDVGVSGGLSLGVLQSQIALVSPSQGQNTYVLNPANGAALKGFPWFQADTVFATPAIADVEGDGQDQIIEAGNTTAGHVYDHYYINGGEVRILSETGNGGNKKKPNGGLFCEYTVNQGVDSSPAVGDILPGDKPGIVFGTSTERSGPGRATDDVIAINSACRQVWSKPLNGATTSSPALADVMHNGQLQVVEGTANGFVYALNPMNHGKPYWCTQVPLPGKVLGGVVTADLGNGYQDVIVPTTIGAYILDGKTGRILATIEKGVGLQNSPLVTEDPNGTIGITLAGYSGNRETQHGIIEHFEIAGSNGSVVTEEGAWPEFHHDPQLTGNANAPTADTLGIKGTSVPKATVKEHYSVTLRASGGVGPYTWSRIGGSRPPGLTFTSTGVLSGTPAKLGTYRLPVQVSDKTGTRVRTVLTVRVTA
jgi:hypothetical protein